MTISIIESNLQVAEKQTNNTKNNGFTATYDNLRSRRKKIDKTYYRTITDKKTGESKTIEHRLKDKPLFSQTTLQVYGYYQRLNHMKKGFLCPSIAQIMRNCGCSRNSVIRANDALTKHNIIGIEKTGRSNNIILVQLDRDGFPLKSSGEYATAKALNAKYKSVKNGLRKSTFETSEVPKGDCSYKDRIQFRRRSKKLSPPPDPQPDQKPKFDPASKAAASADCYKKIRAILPKNVNLNLSKTFIEINIAKHGEKYMLWLAEWCLKKSNPTRYFAKGAHNRKGMKAYNKKISREGEQREQREQEQHYDNLNGAIKELGRMNFLKEI